MRIVFFFWVIQIYFFVFIQKNITTSSIAIWALLYPLYLDSNLKQEYLSSFENILKWINNLESLSEFKDALSRFKISPGQVSYQALAAGECYINKSQTGNDATKNDSANQSPTHQVDIVTAEELKAAEEAWFKGKERVPKQKPIVTPV